ncbi:MAG: hypothetical protein LBP95_06880 [Deltaproteobacteria bacterium]|jgi:hypothetical protein|nr:hypothetical protein [Deltaproteobacteria bacterium]
MFDRISFLFCLLLFVGAAILIDTKSYAVSHWEPELTTARPFYRVYEPPRARENVRPKVKVTETKCDLDENGVYVCVTREYLEDR